MLHTEYEHLMLHRLRQQQLEAARAGRRHLSHEAPRGRRAALRTLAHGLGTSLVAAGRMLQSL
jgi:hypothetical protein